MLKPIPMKHVRLLVLTEDLPRASLTLAQTESAQDELESSLNAARQTMSDSDAGASWMAGWGMQPDEVVEFALGESAARAISPAS